MFDFIKNEHEILKLWRERDVFVRMMEKNKNSKEIFRTLDGPITANGSMCIHHVWGRSYKDAILKYNTLKGRRSHFQNGFDAQGMWVEVEVEKHLGLNDKKAILTYGLDKFTEKCIERVNHFAEIQTNQSIRLGQIMDWDNSYYTNSDHNIESIWKFLKICHERGLLVRSYKSMPWCPRCGTSLSEHEMIGSYKELTHKAVYVKAKLDTGEKILVWTTTPWTLSSNVAIAINPDHKYLRVRVKSDPDLLIVGKEAQRRVIQKEDFVEIVDEFDGRELLGRTYKSILPLNVQTKLEQDGMHKIITWDEVSATDGSGAVHIAPGCGAEDFELGKKLGLAQIVPINEAGIFTDEFEYLAGLGTKQSEDVIFEKLMTYGTLHFSHDFTHNYPFCWRCKTDVVFKLVDGWDIATAPIKDELIAAARTVTWDPPFLQKTMENWLETMGDWNISRRRFYGLPLPIYPCDCGHIAVVGSKDELKSLAIDKTTVDKIPHLHRPYIDEVQIKCPNCGKPVNRVPDVGDCWLDAGIAFESTAAKDYFPSQVVIEMKEQIRLWFYSLLLMSVVMNGRSPFQHVVGYGTILDEEGKKFSKTGINNIKFDDAAESYGADVMRYLFLGANPANDSRFGPNMIDEARRKLLAFHNAFVFYDTYASIDKPNVKNFTPKDLKPTDKWLVATLNEYIKNCEQSYEKYRLHEVTAYTEALVEDLSNFYIRVNRRRFWKNENGTDKMNAYWALYTAIKTINVIMAPITPFLSEHIWQKMGEEGLCMTANFPTQIKVANCTPELIQGVSFIQKVISQSLSLRAREGLKLKQPLRTLYVKADKKHAATIQMFTEVLLDEINVKNIEIVTSEEKFNVPYLTVNFKTAGMTLKGEVQNLKNTLAALDDAEMQKIVAMFAKGNITVGAFKDLPTSVFTRNLKSKMEYVSSTEDDLTVVLDTTLDNELVEEGMLRELIRTIQIARQDANLEITWRISLALSTKSDELNQIIQKHKDKICAEVLCTEFVADVKNGYKTIAEIEGHPIEIALKQA